MKKYKRKPSANALYRRQLRDINKQISELKGQRSRLVQAMKKDTVIRYTEYGRPIHLYALRLEGGKYYVGASRDPEARFKKHSKGKGAKWTKLHKPIEIIETQETEHYIIDDALVAETDLTIRYAMKYGSENVRGGDFCFVEHSMNAWADVVVQNEELYTSAT